MSNSFRPRNAFRIRTALGMMLAAAIVTIHAHAQGCAQCLDTTQSTPPAVQSAYRHAIYLLVAAASTLFAATLIIIRRNR